MIRLAMALPVLVLSTATALAGCPVARRAGEVAPALLRPASGEIQKTFGLVMHPLLNVSKLHAGLDFKGDRGDAVIAAADGTVLEAGRRGGYGNLIVLDHGGGWQTAYAHLDRVVVAPGSCVARGARIADEGNTGLSTGPHLHFEVRHDGRPVDPRPMLPAAGP